MAAPNAPRLRLVHQDDPRRPATSGPAYSAAAAAALTPATTPATTTATHGANTTATHGANTTATHGANTTATQPANSPAGANTPPANSTATEPANTATGSTSDPANAAPASPIPAESSGPQIQPYGRPKTLSDLLREILEHWLRKTWAAAFQAARHPAHAFWHAHPQSLAEHYDYVTGRTWLPEGHEGKVLPALGFLFHCTLGAGCKALGRCLDFVSDTPTRFFITLVLLAGSWAGLHFAGGLF